MPLKVYIDLDLQTTDHEKQIIAYIRTLIDHGQHDEAKRILMHQTARRLILRRVVTAIDTETDEEYDPPPEF